MCRTLKGRTLGIIGPTWLMSLVLAAGGTAPSAGGQEARTTDSVIVKDLRAYMNEIAGADRFSGDVVWAKGDKTLFTKAYGYADREANIRNMLDTKFSLASVSKLFTSIATLQLVQSGKLSLDDALIKVFPDYPNKDIGSKITIRQLLTHRSGLAGLTNFGADLSHYPTAESFLPMFANEPLTFEPGTQFGYSNAGYLVLGMVIAHVSGESYDDYVKDHIFKPAGMTNSGFFTRAENESNWASPYKSSPSGGRTTDAMGQATHGLDAAGGAASTVVDMMRFAQALGSHKLLNADLNAVGDIGLHGQTVDGIRILGGNGGGPGMSTSFSIYPELGYVVVILSNYDGGAGLVDGRLRWELTGHELPQPVHIAANILHEFEGEYMAMPSGAPAGGGQIITAAGSAASPGAQAGGHVPIGPGSAPPSGGGPHIFLAGPDGKAIQASPLSVIADSRGLAINLGVMSGTHEFLPLSSSEFFDAANPGARLTFTRDEKGAVTGLTIRGGGPMEASTAMKLPAGDTTDGPNKP